MTFQPGQSGNPEGRPKGAKNFTTKVKEALEKISDGKAETNEVLLIKSILKKAIDDGDSASQKLIWNYLDGMPIQKLSGDAESPLVIKVVNYGDNDSLQLSAESLSVTLPKEQGEVQDISSSPEVGQE